MHALILIKPLARDAESVAERLAATKHGDSIVLLDTGEILIWLTFENTEGLTSMLKQIREIPGVQSTESKLVLSRMRSEQP